MNDVSKHLLSIAVVSTLVTGDARANDAHNLCAAPATHPGSFVSIPADDAVHLNPDGSSQHVYEQWYWNAVVVGPHQHIYGIETIVFQFTFAPLPPIDAIQIALTDVTAGTYQNQFIFGGGGYPFVPNGFNIDLADATGRFQAVGGAGHDDLTFTFADGTVAKIAFEGLKNPTPAWFDGFAALVDPITGRDHGGQYYYNRRNMAAYGTVARPGHALVRVLGTGWYDREFGTVIGTPGSQDNNVHWKWLSLHLTDGSDYMVWDMYANDTGNNLVHVINKIGAPPACAESRFTTFSFLGTGATASAAGPPPTTFDRVTHLSIPDDGLEVTITPLTPNQIILSGGLFDPFYEAAATAVGTKNGHPIAGTGYYEQLTSCCQGQ